MKAEDDKNGRGRINAWGLAFGRIISAVLARGDRRRRGDVPLPTARSTGSRGASRWSRLPRKETARCRLRRPSGGDETAPAAQGSPPSGQSRRARLHPPPSRSRGRSGGTRPPAPIPAVPTSAAAPATAPMPAAVLPPAAPASPRPCSAVPPPPRRGPGFFVKFNNADIYEVIHTLGRTAGINYLIDPRVRGVVNVHTQGMLRKDGALDLLFSILKVNGATAIKEGDTYHIVPMSEAKTEPLMPALPGDGAAARVRPTRWPCAPSRCSTSPSRRWRR